ncbi:phospho-sugar mutase [Lachnoanaerobaculum gingivalis]|uniref:phospho-sugar mutase n=1 Tax=Lachnoanaerobaculum gingivalis TaxID=2490855 RepID=UPI0024A7A3DA|nr:phospho-sugar mutase [Lachnoanaerobaculum gingivalis]WHE88123.1 phospho-sugar mutase [Lachnoanaerobaculum gingivalis]
MNELTKKAYETWKNADLADEALVKEMASIANDEEAINDRFYKELAFGTGGLRGVLGVGSNRMNIYTVGKASRGLANYINSISKAPKLAISYDSRNNSDVFAKRAASIFAGVGIKVYIWKELMPTPALSFAVRELGCDGGIMVTASHNPAKYNGYKVYGADGCQIANEAADRILDEINSVETFSNYELVDFEEGLKSGIIEYISEDTFNAFMDAVSTQTFIGDDVDKDVKIAYTPLYGTGLRCVTTCLKKNGFTNIEIVKEQATPNGDFPTCPYPNPEIREALEVGLNVAKEVGADILIATDPDCDRVGIAVKQGDDFRLFSGNEVGVLLTDFIAKRKVAMGIMPKKPVVVKTIVTTDLANRVADSYGIETRDVLTGFKYIGDQIANLERDGEVDRYLLGFEESYGYLSGSYVRDKDAVNGAYLIAQMFAYYKAQNKSLLDVLNGLYEKYGYYLNTLYSFEFEGESGMKKMDAIMDTFRNNTPKEIAGVKVLEVRDYETSAQTNLVTGEKKAIDLPKSNVIKYMLEGNSSAVLRPSGTEPKLKLYLAISSENEASARELETKIANELKKSLA